MKTNTSQQRAAGRAAVLGAGAAFAISIVGGLVGQWIENRWDIVVISWEMAGMVVSILVTLGGFFAGPLAAFSRSVVFGTLIGSVGVGAGLAGISLTNGSPSAVATWAIAVGICAGAAAGATGAIIGKRGATQ